MKDRGFAPPLPLPTNGFLRWIKRITAALVLLGLLGSGAFAVDSRYAKAGDVIALRGSLAMLGLRVEIGQLDNRRATLRQEQYTLTDPRVPLTTRDRERLAVVNDEINVIDERLRALRIDLIKLERAQ